MGDRRGVGLIPYGAGSGLNGSGPYVWRPDWDWPVGDRMGPDQDRMGCGQAIAGNNERGSGSMVRC